MFNTLKAALKEGVPLQIEVVLFHPVSPLLTAVEFFKVGVLNVGATVAQDNEETKDERALADRVSNGFDKIPSEPANVVDSMVA